MAKRSAKYDYTQTLNLKHNERAGIIDLETGDFRMPDNLPNNLPEDREMFIPDHYFDKVFYASQYVWVELEKVLTDLEYRVAHRLTHFGDMNNNSLRPLNDQVLLKDLSKEFNVSINKVKPVFKKLFDLGVYANVRVADMKYPGIENFWILNPYLSFSGKFVNSNVLGVFNGTPIAAMFREGMKHKKIKPKHIK